MTTREDAGVTTAKPDVIVSIDVPGKPEALSPQTPQRPVRPRRLLAAVAGAVVLAAVVAGAAAILSDDDDVVAQPVAEQPAEVPAAPDPLAITVDAPASATAGESVDITVTYSDGSGTFTGTSEEWGDDVGTSSLREGVCTAADPAPGALAGTYVVSHTWTDPGTYTLTLGVHSSTCRGTRAVQEKATETVTLKVLAR